MYGLQLSRTSAAFVTFLLSALCHELVMAVVTKKIRPYLFLMQVSWDISTLRRRDGGQRLIIDGSIAYDCSWTTTHRQAQQDDW